MSGVFAIGPDLHDVYFMDVSIEHELLMKICKSVDLDICAFVAWLISKSIRADIVTNARGNVYPFISNMISVDLKYYEHTKQDLYIPDVYNSVNDIRDYKNDIQKASRDANIHAEIRSFLERLHPDAVTIDSLYGQYLRNMCHKISESSVSYHVYNSIGVWETRPGTSFYGVDDTKKKKLKKLNTKFRRYPQKKFIISAVVEVVGLNNVVNITMELSRMSYSNATVFCRTINELLDMYIDVVTKKTDFGTSCSFYDHTESVDRTHVCKKNIDSERKSVSCQKEDIPKNGCAEIVKKTTFIFNDD